MLSLIIPTLNRPHFLKRILEYLGERDFSCPILVADSSTEPARSINEETVASGSHVLDIEYRSYDSRISFVSKVAEALSVPDTEYCMLCADDVFPVPRAIETCIGFLQSNPDYAAVNGQVVNLYAVEPIAHGRLLAGIEHGLSMGKLWVTPTTPRPPITLDQTDPCARICAHLLNYHPTFYSVHRRASLLSNMQAAVAFGSDYLFCELLPSSLTVIQGKKKHIDQLHIVRPLHEEDSTSALVAKSTYCITEDDFSKRYVRFRKQLVETIVASDNLFPGKVANMIDKAFEGFVAQNLIDRAFVQSRNERESRIVRMARQIDRISRVFQALPRSISKGNRLRGMIRSPMQYAKLLHCEGGWISSRMQVPIDRLPSAWSGHRDDLLPICESVINHLTECPLSFVRIDVS